jgi:hypothetical protein
MLLGVPELPVKSLARFSLIVTAVLSVYGKKLTEAQGHTSPLHEEFCKNFTYGNPQALEFYSPGFPRNYPAGIKCFRAITADYGYFVRIDFRDSFQIEPPSNEGKCEYDYLEIRDGDQGYSPLIGKFCGSNFPPIITSSGRSLWLRFVSDLNIEYSGFKGVYHYIPNPIDTLPYIPKCEFEITGEQNYIGTENISQVHRDHANTYKRPIDCTWNIRTNKEKLIYIQFDSYKLEKPNDCNFNFLEIFNEKTDSEHRAKTFCGSVAESFQSSSNVIYIRFFADGKGIESEFVAIFTAYRSIGSDAQDKECPEDEYDCDDATCISSDLKCNGVRNCKFGWDEEMCAAKGSAIPLDFSAAHVIVILILLILIMAGMCTGMIYNLVRKLSEDKEDILASREKSLASLASCNDSECLPVNLPPTPAKSRTSRATSNTDCNGCYVPSPPDGGFPFSTKF